MAEPIPSASNDPEDPPAATNAEDRKAAAALDALNAKSMSQENGDSSGAKQPTAADQEALGKAMARLEGVVGGGKSGTAGKKVDSGKGEGKVVTAASTAREKRKEEEAARRKIKVDVGDVQFLVSEFDLTKAKATDLLRTYDGVLDTAVKNYVSPTIRA